MKTKTLSLLLVILFTTTQCMTQNKITVTAENNDISNNLDLKAVATAFGESKDLQEFEQKLNDYDSGISNLDLNNDGHVDYLRVIEKAENNTHVVVIQAVIDKDVYQDVATIIVDKDQNNSTTVQVVGDPYIYGPNYIIEPAYLYTPSIFSFFWGPNYYSWYSPYYWGYYPSYYHRHRPYALNVYMSNVYSHINHSQRYYYSNSIRNSKAMIIQQTIHRNDFELRNPDRNFNNRNVNVRNKRDFEFNRNGAVRNNYNQGNFQSAKSGRTYESTPSDTRNNQSNGWNQRNPNQSTYQNRTNTSEPSNRTIQTTPNNQTYTAPTNNRYTGGGNTINPNQNNNNTYQPRPNTDNGNSGNRNYGNSKPNPQVTQTKPVERKVTVTPQVVKEPRREKDNSNNDRK